MIIEVRSPRSSGGMKIVRAEIEVSSTYQIDRTYWGRQHQSTSNMIRLEVFPDKKNREHRITIVKFSTGEIESLTVIGENTDVTLSNLIYKTFRGAKKANDILYCSQDNSEIVNAQMVFHSSRASGKLYFDGTPDVSVESFKVKSSESNKE